MVNEFTKKLREKTQNHVTHFDARESYSKQRSYTKQNFSCPNRTYTKLDLFQSGHIPRYHCNSLMRILPSGSLSCFLSEKYTIQVYLYRSLMVFLNFLGQIQLSYLKRNSDCCLPHSHILHDKYHFVFNMTLLYNI
jgi:hypothetical protein